MSGVSEELRQVMRQLEYGVLGCALDNLRIHELEIVMDECPASVTSYRERQAVRYIERYGSIYSDPSSTELINSKFACWYTDRIRLLFHTTKDKFDWGKPAGQMQLLGRRPVSEVRESQEPTMKPGYNQLCRLLFALFLKKNAVYKDSYKRRGEIGIFHNLARKFDRIESIVETAGKGNILDPELLPDPNTTPESLLTTTLDEVNYGIMWALVQIENRYEEFQDWLVTEGLETEWQKILRK